MPQRLRVQDEIRMALTTFLIVFVTLKCTGLIHWSWWEVTAPFWIPAIAVVFAILGALAFNVSLTKEVVK